MTSASGRTGNRYVPKNGRTNNRCTGRTTNRPAWLVGQDRVSDGARIEPPPVSFSLLNHRSPYPHSTPRFRSCQVNQKSGSSRGQRGKRSASPREPPVLHYMRYTSTAVPATPPLGPTCHATRRLVAPARFSPCLRSHPCRATPGRSICAVPALPGQDRTCSTQHSRAFRYRVCGVAPRRDKARRALLDDHIFSSSRESFSPSAVSIFPTSFSSSQHSSSQ